jgi:hypothetical protein
MSRPNAYEVKWVGFVSSSFEEFRASGIVMRGVQQEEGGL